LKDRRKWQDVFRRRCPLLSNLSVRRGGEAGQAEEIRLGMMRL
jgi:hypothetical protein